MSSTTAARTGRGRGRPTVLTDAQKAQIAQLGQEGKDYLEISKLLGINRGSVRYWLGKKSVNNTSPSNATETSKVE